MTTTAAVIDRVRLEISDNASPFIANSVGDGVTTVFDLPAAPVSTAGLSVAVDNVAIDDYDVDVESGSISFYAAPPAGAQIVATGTGYRFFTDEQLAIFIDSALKQHLHGRGLTLTTLPPVEDYLVALLASIEALYALLNDATFDIDVNTPEGVSVPRHQRWQQIMQMIQLREKQYMDLASALNVGLWRVEQFTLRRVSRTTNRLVPVYKPREIEDTRPPERVFLPIDSQGGDEVPMALDPTVLDIRFRQGNHYELPLTLPVDLTGCTVYASIRRYVNSARIRDFTITYGDRPTGQVTLSLPAGDTTYLAHQLFWQLDVHFPDGNEITYYQGRAEVDRARYGIAQPYGV